MPNRLLRLGLAVLLLVATAGCTGGDDDDPTPPAESSTSPSDKKTAAAPQLGKKDAPLEVSIEQLRGAIKRKQYATLEKKIAKPISAWIAAGFSDVEYPKASYDGAFKSWTLDARKLARRDGDVTTNGKLGKDLATFVVEKQRVRLYVFASRALTGGATARLALRFTGETEEGKSASYAVIGSLYLTRDKGHWRIFGYDLVRKEVD